MKKLITIAALLIVSAASAQNTAYIVSPNGAMTTVQRTGDNAYFVTTSPGIGASEPLPPVIIPPEPCAPPIVPIDTIHGIRGIEGPRGIQPIR